MPPNALAESIRTGDFAQFAQLLQADPVLGSTPLPSGEWPIHLAVEHDDPAMVRALFSVGASLDARYQGGHTPLSWAVTTGSLHAAHALVELGAVPDLFCASGLGLLDRVRALSESEASELSTTGSSRFTGDGERLPVPPPAHADQISDALYIACRSGQAAVAEYLLSQGADPNWRGFMGGTPLHWAEFSGKDGLADLIRRAGGDDALADDAFGATPRQFRGFVLAAWGFPLPQLAAWLDAHPEQLKATTTRGNLADVAHRAHNFPAVEFLESRGLRPTHVDSDASPAP